MNRIARTAVLAATILTMATASIAAGPDARIRVGHLSPDTDPVDILINGQAAIRGLEFGDVTPYVPVPANLYDVEVVLEGTAGPAPISFTDGDAASFYFGTDYTILAIDTFASIKPLVLVDTNERVRGNSAMVRFVHASPDAPMVDIVAQNGPRIFSNIAFGSVGDYIEVPAGRYNLDVVVSGTETVALTAPAVRLSRGSTYTIYATGFVTPGSGPALDALITEDNRSRNRFIRYYGDDEDDD